LIKRVVVTGVGTRPAGHLVGAFKRRGWLVVGADTEFHPQQVNQFYIVSRGDHPGFVDELLMLVGRERTTLLIPTRDIEWLPIARRSKEFRRLSAGVFLPEPVTVEDIVSTGQTASLLRRAGVDVWDVTAFPPPMNPTAQWFEAAVCRDGRIPYEAFACSVHELSAGEHPAVPRAERRKGESEVEELAVRAVQSLGLPGPATVHLRRDAEGRVAVARVILSPCDYAPLTDDVLDAFLALWEGVQPP
jgi:hypothetical protein